MNQKLPFALKVVAVLCILGGVSSVIEVIVALMESRIFINFGVLGIFIGIGLFRLSQGWRTCALVFTWITLLALPVIGFLLWGQSGPIVFNIFGQKAGYVSKEFMVFMCAVFFIYTVWQYRVLTRPDVRRLFRNPASTPLNRSPAPKTLQSARFGTLSLHESRSSSFYFCCYTAPYEHPACGAIKVVFHPPDSDPAFWGDALNSVEQRANDLLGSQRAILLTGASRFEKLFSNYKIEETKIDAVFPRLKLRLLRLNSKDEDELVYAPCDLFPSFDLFVSVNRDLRVTKAHFDG